MRAAGGHRPLQRVPGAAGPDTILNVAVDACAPDAVTAYAFHWSAPGLFVTFRSMTDTVVVAAVTVITFDATVSPQ